MTMWRLKRVLLLIKLQLNFLDIENERSMSYLCKPTEETLLKGVLLATIQGGH